MGRGNSKIPPWKDKRRVAQIYSRVEKHASGEEDGRGPMTASQLKAAEIILRKAIPDLKAVEHSGNEESPVVVMGKVMVNGKPLVPDVGEDKEEKE